MFHGTTRRTTLRFCALALILVALLAACGGDAVPGENADTEAPAPEATDRVRAPAPGSVATDREILVTVYNALDGPNWEDSENWLSDAPLGARGGVNTCPSQHAPLSEVLYLIQGADPTSDLLAFPPLRTVPLSLTAYNWKSFRNL